MSPRKKAGSTQDKLEKSLNKATTKKEKETGVIVKKYKGQKATRNKEADEEWLQSMEKKYNQLKDRKASTALILMSEFAFLLELARE